eukprot:TRINITY_DN5851_c0_g1_i16.p1 TRINITY_DN5851_c0_g1~~TRINITY_DN5851_c0_g1_i16.p1  ORF type:complete len:820 (+),score=181.45 TRINITY_DN5851_c0_g1_i16:313-2772(+)
MVSHTNYPVREISIDTAGEFVASCADDGRVVIHGLYTKSTVEHTFKQPVTCVSLDPGYAKNKKEAFVCGGKSGKLIMSEKGWWSASNTVLHEGEGTIYAIAWERELIAWANDIGVKIYDCNAKERITYIDRPRNSPRPDLYRCCLCWEDPTTIIIGWADSVKIGKVKPRPRQAEGLPGRCVEIISMFRVENCFICGLAPFHKDLIVLSYPEQENANSRGSRPRPELTILTRDNEEISSEALNIYGYENCSALDYRLDFSPAELLFYLVSPKDIVVAKPRDLDDHITWLLEKGEREKEKCNQGKVIECYEEALNAVEGRERELRKQDPVKVGEKYIEYLLLYSVSKDEAAHLCPRIFKDNPQLWEKWIYTFAREKQIKVISPYIPVTNPTLSDVTYEMVLSMLMNTDPEQFLHMIEKWPPTIYNLHNIITALEEKERVGEIKGSSLLLALAKLYTYDKQFDKTLYIYLQLSYGDVFELISTHNLFSKIGDKVLELMRFDEVRATALLVNNVQHIPVASVVHQLKSDEKLQLRYLDTLFFHSKKEYNQEGKEFHNLQVQLYAKIDREPLLDFLEKSDFWVLEEAHEICKKAGHWKEVVYILGRLGSFEEAIKLIIEKVGDVKQAIDFIQKQNDPTLWDHLIKKSMGNPVFVSGLLDNLGTHINPLHLIEKIPEGMEIIGLRDRLVKIINDYLLQTSLSQGCREILKADVITLNKKMHMQCRRPIRIDSNTTSLLSNQPIIGPASRKKNVIAFFCNHTYLEEELVKLIAQQVSARNPGAQPLQPIQVEALQKQLQQDEGYYCPVCRQNTENTKLERKKTRRK